MSAIKPIIRQAKEAVLDGMSHAKNKLHRLADNMNDHLDNVVKQVRDKDKFDAPNNNGTPGGSNNVPNGNGNGGGNDGLPFRDENGRFAPNPDGPGDSRYDRPSGWRAGMRDTAWNDARGRDGLVRDPETGDVLDPNQPWVMGHPPGWEFRHHQRSAAERDIPREQFLDEYFSVPYRPESPSTSSSGKHELGWDDYVGP